MLIKRLKILISSLLYCCDIGKNKIYSFLGKTSPASCVVLYYHGIKKDERLLFARQLDALLKHAQPIRADVQLSQLPGSHCVSVTIDDGFACALENAVPELIKRNIPFTVFVPSGFVGKVAEWLKCEKERKETVIGADQLRNLNDNDLAVIGSHCITHQNLCRLNYKDSRREIFESKRALEQLLGVGVNLLSFPYGAYNDTYIAYAKEAGYKRVFTTMPTTAFRVPDEFVSGRVSVEPTDSDLEFRLKLYGTYRWLPLAFRLKRKLHSMLNCEKYGLYCRD